ncbi:ABC transporter ATP-binding protein [Paralimibaculum aggregatum]|uniref:ABC transporter ATP-binding protein n=1 Tax=Paralimibaculum aggregatum TaxID=3036245 RepID=A0ABQ6LKG5_9RHOB|nr:ATP-binding cassette domain-containing protein [Limibaculum sp. NKW23]GMG81149.1 ABC transporter ATP-binding protein [Limibaculum sp. NKW23]
MAEAAPVLEVSGLSKRFGALIATDAVDLDIRPGEIHALIGPNGAGKSTLVAQIAGQLAQDAGEIRLAGQEISGLSVAARARAGLGRTFQVTSVALELSALGNAMLAVQARASGLWGFWRRAAADRRLIEPAMAALARFDLDGRAQVPAAALSHGERRQLELAMAAALAPRVLLLDEPMAGLGAGGVGPLSDILEGLKAETPMLLIEHDMDAVFRLADRISVLAEGRIVFAGSAAEVQASALVREIYLGTA